MLTRRVAKTQATAGSPEALAAAAEAIPAELRERDQWVVWRYEERDGKRTKVPYRPAQPRRRASATDAATWGSFAEARAVAEAGRADGIGFVFTADDPYVGIDLDDCLDDAGALDPTAARLVDALGSYTERTPSGRGLHIIVRAEADAGRRGVGAWGGAIEVYPHGRYFTMTGASVGEAGIAQADLGALLASFPERPAATTGVGAWERDGGTLTIEDEALIAAARERHGRFAALYDHGDTSAYGDDHSRADLALCSMLAQWTGDPAQIDRVFRSSALYRRKWDRDDYARRTVERALADGEAESAPAAANSALEGQTAQTAQTATRGYARMPFAPTATERGPKSPAAVAARVESKSKPSPPPLESVGVSARELRDTVPPEPDWLVPGVIARGWTVVLGGREKSGKGTLASYLIGALERAEPTVFGPAPAEPVTALIYTEEPEDSLREKLAAFDIERATVIHAWQLAGLTWEQKAAWLADKAAADRHALIFVDNISRATGTDDEAGVELARNVEVLSDHAKARGLAVLIDHHLRKSGGKVEDLLRGGTALPGAVENIVLMERVGDVTSRERRLSARGRVRATVWQRTVELSDDGTTYTDADEADFRERVLRERSEWTAKDFAEAINRDESTARRYLNDSPHVMRVDGTRGGSGGSQAVVYRVIDTDNDPPV